jgi:hypothetical protein
MDLMNPHVTCDPHNSTSFLEQNNAGRRYAWLEHEGKMWHFLPDLFAHPGESTRSWADKQHALEELIKEGWAVVRPYYETFPVLDKPMGSICGYGLVWTNR